MREFYIFASEGNFRRLSASAWLGHLILAVEYMILYKFSKGIFDVNRFFPRTISRAYYLNMDFYNNYSFTGTMLCALKRSEIIFKQKMIF